MISQTNHLLGYPADARLLIINADDFGMCQAVNEAIFQSLAQGVLRSATLMVPCPWAWQAMQFLAEQPEIAFGVHLTAVCEWSNYRWGPVTSRDKVPSLVNKWGHFYNFAQVHARLGHIRLDELEREWRAQIEVVLAAGLRPSHLDWHALRLDGYIDIFEVMLRLAQEYGLALRVRGQACIETVQSQGLPCNDVDFLDSYGLATADKLTQYTQLLRDLPAGLSEWAVHPGLNNAELLAIEGETRHVRQTDLDFLLSAEAQAVIAAEGIVLLDYRPLQAIWQQAR